MVFKIPALAESLLYWGDSSSENLLNENLDHHPERVYRVLIWNVYKGIKSQFLGDLERLIPSQDFLLLQEVIHRAQNPEMHSPLLRSYHWRVGVSFHIPSQDVKTGVAIGALWQPEDSKMIRTTQREWHFLTPKTAVLNRFLVQNKSVLVVNCHAINFVLNKSYFDSMNLLAEKIIHHQGPLLVAGDFNTWNGPRWQGLLSIFRNIGLEHIPLENDRRWLKLDHVFCRGLRVHQAKVVPHIKGSDHLPLLFEFSL